MIEYIKNNKIENISTSDRQDEIEMHKLFCPICYYKSSRKLYNHNAADCFFRTTDIACNFCGEEHKITECEGFRVHRSRVDDAAEHHQFRLARERPEYREPVPSGWETPVREEAKRESPAADRSRSVSVGRHPPRQAVEGSRARASVGRPRAYPRMAYHHHDHYWKNDFLAPHRFPDARDEWGRARERFFSPPEAEHRRRRAGPVRWSPRAASPRGRFRRSRSRERGPDPKTDDQSR